MKKLKVFPLLLACLLALCFLLASCEEILSIGGENTKTGTIVFTNSSTYAEDNPVNVQLVRQNDSYLLLDVDVARSKSVTWKDLAAEVYYRITVTDKNGRVSSNGYISLSFGQTRRFRYNGSNISESN